MTKINKEKLLYFFLSGILIFTMLGFNNISFAQGESSGDNTKKQLTLEKDLLEEDTDEPDDTEQNVQIKQSPAYTVLGRKLTEHEREVYSDASPGQIKDQLLYKEYKLVIVRAILALGERESINQALETIPNSQSQKTFTELVEYLSGLKEKYGSVSNGLQAEVVERNTDEKLALQNAAQNAYKEVFVIKLEDEDLNKLVTYFRSNEIASYSEMINSLKNSMTPEDKKNILIKALNEVGRIDLVKNEKFITKILSKDFTYKNLMDLFKPLKNSVQKTAPVKKHK